MPPTVGIRAFRASSTLFPFISLLTTSSTLDATAWGPTDAIWVASSDCVPFSPSMSSRVTLPSPPSSFTGSMSPPGVGGATTPPSSGCPPAVCCSCFRPLGSCGVYGSTSSTLSASLRASSVARVSTLSSASLRSRSAWMSSAMPVTVSLAFSPTSLIFSPAALPAPVTVGPIFDAAFLIPSVILPATPLAFSPRGFRVLSFFLESSLSVVPVAFSAADLTIPSSVMMGVMTART